MPANRKEQFVYTFLMVALMAFIMISYNDVLQNGVSINSIKQAWLGFPLTFLVAFLCEWFVIGRFGMPIIFKTLKEEDSALKKMLLSRLIIVSGMVILMSFSGPILSVGFSLDILLEWPKNMVLNFIVAYPLQVLVARPFVRFVFRKSFFLGTTTVPVRI